jgi:hypothetical protein
MQPDGDVWGLLRNMLTQRGPRATEITKVKGHAAMAVVQSGQVHGQGRAGNNAADAAVAQGLRSYKASRRAIADLHEERARDYTKLDASIQRLMLDIVSSTRRKRAEMLSGMMHGTRGARRAPLAAMVEIDKLHALGERREARLETRVIAARSAMDHQGRRPLHHAVAVGHQPAPLDVEVDLGPANPGAHAILPKAMRDFSASAATHAAAAT